MPIIDYYRNHIDRYTLQTVAIIGTMVFLFVVTMGLLPVGASWVEAL